MKKTLVVFYSRTGHTRRVAESLAQALDADLEEIKEARNRTGLFGALRSALEAVMKRCPDIDPARRDPATYDEVVIGTPVWVGHVSSPVRSYLAQHAASLPRVGLFCTFGGSDAGRVLEELAALAGRTPVATLAIVDRESGQSGNKPLRFADALRGRSADAPA